LSRLVVVGSISRDVVAGGPPRAGGAPYWCGRALASLERPGAIVARCALADAGELVPAVEELGVPLTVVPSRSTPAFSFAYDGDVRRMTVEDVSEPWTARQLAAVPEDTAGVHVGALFAGEFPPEAIAAVASDDRLVSLDGQGLVRVAQAGPLELRAPDDPADLLGAVDVLKLSVREAEALLGAVTRKALGRLGVPEVIVTYGERGAAVWADGRLEHVPPPRLLTREPTGAGDSFAIGYLDARLGGAGPIEAAEAAAALVTEVLDAT
jgi:sugar/nucleoside kinase (ribokinase family)